MGIYSQLQQASVVPPWLGRSGVVPDLNMVSGSKTVGCLCDPGLGIKGSKRVRAQKAPENGSEKITGGKLGVTWGKAKELETGWIDLEENTGDGL